MGNGLMVQVRIEPGSWNYPLRAIRPPLGGKLVAGRETGKQPEANFENLKRSTFGPVYSLLKNGMNRPVANDLRGCLGGQAGEMKVKTDFL